MATLALDDSTLPLACSTPAAIAAPASTPALVPAAFRGIPSLLAISLVMFSNDSATGSMAYPMLVLSAIIDPL
ncbi:Uncharacterised protein [Mycobacteroides abscessus subsp. abscessus]|nr:Uncharacterised protein [Mycobacteroides abscessus subsp. abscessus]SIA88577.1 Uncharacterised protein [Mycobacteroides abscessus subsp. abscessus]SIC65180.1 Uncharacterised protein [Mycobacteroides abscessus subsp. abscessus]SID74153.1 Uncharacterised protein [Mycobacteroides abscessus subsp. abscessus]